jgi:hypothetical protein
MSEDILHYVNIRNTLTYVVMILTCIQVSGLNTEQIS